MSCSGWTVSLIGALLPGFIRSATGPAVVTCSGRPARPTPPGARSRTGTTAVTHGVLDCFDEALTAPGPLAKSAPATPAPAGRSSGTDEQRAQ